MSLVAEVKKFFDKTILLSGCISTGRDVASAMQMGADLAYMGTRFINTEESKATDEYRQMIIDAGASDGSRDASDISSLLGIEQSYTSYLMQLGCIICRVLPYYRLSEVAR